MGSEMCIRDRYSIANTSQINKVKDKWDCLSISDKSIKLIDNGFLFVDEITKDLFV